jgi:DNA polymerase
MDTEGKLKREELQPLVDAWRAANPAIVALWRIVNDAALHCVETGESVNLMHGIKMFMERGVFFILLPSGRKLTYIKPRLVVNRFGGMSVGYEGQNQTTNKWEQQETYGGKLVENIVQAIARDLLVAAMLRADRFGYNIVLHVHDEIVAEMMAGKGSVEELNNILATPVEWAEGLPLKAAGFESTYYKKD